MPPTQSTAVLVKNYIKDNVVMVFSKTTCPFCAKVKALFDSLGVPFQVFEVDNDVNTSEIQEELFKISNLKTVPNVFINGQHLGGCDATLKAHNEGRLLPMIQSQQQQTYDYDLVVIGGGSGGLAASKQAARHGKRVAVLDFVKPTPKGTTWGLGGTCVNVGCIPKKLMHQASLLGKAVKEAKAFGWDVDAETVKLSWENMVEAVQNHIGSLNWGYRVQLRSENVTYINSYGMFIDNHTIKAVNRRGKEQQITSDKFIIAVGERPRYPDIPGAKEFCITSDDLFSLSYCPGKTLVIGASYVALECAGFLSGIGLDVTVMVRSIFLRGFDQQIAEKIGAHMEQDGVKFLRRYVPVKIEQLTLGEPGLLKVTGKSTETGTEITEEYNTVILAIGRDSATNTIGLENTGVVAAKNGKIPVNEFDQTNIPNIYCIGDNAQDKPELTPVAIQSGKLLSNRLFGGSTIKCDYGGVPTTVFTPLEYSCCGFSEESAAEMFGENNVEVYHSAMWPLEWTVPAYDSNTCYVKAIANKLDNEKIVDLDETFKAGRYGHGSKIHGLHYLGPNAGEVMQGFAAAMKCGLTKFQLDATIGIHPTNAEMFTTLNVTKSSGESINQTGC